MDWKFAARRLAKDLTHVAHGSAVAIFAAGWFSNTMEAAVVAAGTWVVIRGCAFVLDAWAGPAP